MKEFENDHTYRTGSTNPPKSYRGIIAVLLILVIVLISVVTVLGMMNIRLFRLLEAQQAAGAVAFSDDGVAEVAENPAEGVHFPALGFTGAEIENVYRSYKKWPEGVYITAVTPDGPAEQANLQPGDILIAVDGVPVSGEADCQEKLGQLQPGHTLQLTVFREDEEQSGELTVSLTATK